MPRRKHSTKVPANMQDYYQVLTNTTDKFCHEKLSDDYQELARYTGSTLAIRKGNHCNIALMCAQAFIP